MSLINDALKRARQGQQQNPFGGRSTPPLQPVDYTARPHWFSRTVVGLLLLASLAGAGWFFWKWWRSNSEPRQIASGANEATAPAAVESNAPANPAPRKQTIKVSTNIVVRANLAASARLGTAAQTASTNAPIPAPPSDAAASASQVNVAAPAPPPSPFADLKLQSIIYREDKPSAVISGEMLFVGEEVRGARLLKIGRQSVTVERNGETNELRLPRL